MTTNSGSGSSEHERPGLIHIDRNLTVGFGLVVLAVILTVTVVAGTFYQRIARNNEEQLQQTITLILGEAIDRISFSGKYHARLLVEQIVETQPRMVYIMIADERHEVLAHSDAVRNDTQIAGTERAIYDWVIESEESHLRDREVAGHHIREIAMPYRSGYDDAVTGVLFVGISTEEYTAAVGRTSRQMVFLAIVLTLSALGATYLLSKFFAGPVKRMAWQLQGILKHAPLFISITNQHREVLASSAAAQMGRKPDSLGSGLEAVFSRGVVLTAEETVECDGETRHLLTTSFPIVACADGAAEQACVISVDVTERYRALRALRDSEELLRAIFDATADGILVENNETGCISHSNRRFEEIWQVPAAVLRRQDATEYRDWFAGQVAAPEDFDARTSAICTSDAPSLDEITLKDGRSIERFSSPLIQDGKKVARVWNFRDITERRAAEKEREQLEAQVLHAQKLESLGVLAGGIAHDFNNILAAVLGYAELAAAQLDPSNPAQADVHEVIRGANRAAELTQQMLAYSGRGEFVVEQLDLSALLEEMANLLRTSIPRTTTLEFKLDPELPLIEGDVAQLQQIVMNLITNAADAIGDEPGTIALASGQLDCDAAYLSYNLASQSAFEVLTPGPYVYVEVRDTGCGMDEHTKARLFEPFFSTKFTGRGLGMAAVLGIVRGHDGAVLLETAPGAGSTFRVLFPVLATTAQRPEGPVEPAQLMEPATQGQILVVDDDDAVRSLARKLLEQDGFLVLDAPDGGKALEVFRASSAEIDCVLLDLTMPYLSGEACLRELRRIQEDVKVIAMSGYAEERVSELFPENSPAGFLHKPFRRSELRAKIERVLNAVS